MPLQRRAVFGPVAHSSPVAASHCRVPRGDEAGGRYREDWGESRQVGSRLGRVLLRWRAQTTLLCSEASFRRSYRGLDLTLAPCCHWKQISPPGTMLRLTAP